MPDRATPQIPTVLRVSVIRSLSDAFAAEPGAGAVVRAFVGGAIRDSVLERSTDTAYPGVFVDGYLAQAATIGIAGDGSAIAFVDGSAVLTEVIRLTGAAISSPIVSGFTVQSGDFRLTGDVASIPFIGGSTALTQVVGLTGGVSAVPSIGGAIPVALGGAAVVSVGGISIAPFTGGSIPLSTTSRQTGSATNTPFVGGSTIQVGISSQSTGASVTPTSDGATVQASTLSQSDGATVIPFIGGSTIQTGDFRIAGSATNTPFVGGSTIQAGSSSQSTGASVTPTSDGATFQASTLSQSDGATVIPFIGGSTIQVEVVGQAGSTTATPFVGGAIAVSSAPGVIVPAGGAFVTPTVGGSAVLTEGVRLAGDETVTPFVGGAQPLTIAVTDTVTAFNAPFVGGGTASVSEPVFVTVQTDGAIAGAFADGGSASVRRAGGVVVYPSIAGYEYQVPVVVPTGGVSVRPFVGGVQFPIESTNLLRWWRADRGITLNANNRVTAWTDQVAADSAVSFSDATSPVLGTINGQTSISFSNAQYLYTSLQTYASTYMVVACLPTAAVDYNGIVCRRGNSSGKSGYPLSGLGDNSGFSMPTTGRIIFLNNLATGSRFGALDGVQSTAIVTFNGTASLSGTAMTMNVAHLLEGWSSVGSFSHAWMFGADPLGSARLYTGQLGEVRIYSQIPSSAQRALIEAEMEAYWGVV